MKFNDYWEKTHKKYYDDKVIYDHWLDSYKVTLDSCRTKILDLGCGTGNDSLYLFERGYQVLACDYSLTALKKVKCILPEVETKLVDIASKLPFEDHSFDVIIADLSLHYFDDKTTISIMNELKRILTNKGHLLARVNSVLDYNYGAGSGKQLEKNYYFVDGYNKRFFDLEDANKYFSIIGEVNVKESEMLRYSKPKKVIEIDVKKVSK